MNLDQARAVAQGLREYMALFGVNPLVCAEGAKTIDALVAENETLRYEVDAIPAIKAERDQLHAELERLKQSILDELPTLEALTKRFGEVCAENEKLREASKVAADDIDLQADIDAARTALLPERKKCVKCGDALMSDFTSTCYACDHQVPDERDNLLNGG